MMRKGAWYNENDPQKAASLRELPRGLQVLYSCHGCGLENAAVTVAYRRDGEDIRSWIEDVAQLVANHHRQRSPECTKRTCDLKIPLADGKGIGEA